MCVGGCVTEIHRSRVPPAKPVDTNCFHSGPSSTVHYHQRLTETALVEKGWRGGGGRRGGG